jgi:hypothetical protein
MRSHRFPQGSTKTATLLADHGDLIRSRGTGKQQGAALL